MSAVKIDMPIDGARKLAATIKAAADEAGDGVTISVDFE